MILEIDGWRFQVFDVTTRKYYAREVAGHCTCATCRNFYQTVDKVYPELRPFLAQFGAHVEAPEEMSAPIQTMCDCYYAVCVSILEAGEEPITVGSTQVHPCSPEEAMVQKCRDLQRMVDRQQVDHDLQRIAWEKDYDDCAFHLHAVCAALREYVSHDAESDALAGSVVALQEAEGFLERQRMMVQ